MTEASVSFAGNLTDDPEVRYTEAGIARAMFRVAVSTRREQEASFFTVVVWRDQAEHAVQSLTKGSRVVVVGRLQQRSWTAEDGSARSTRGRGRGAGAEPPVGDRHHDQGDAQPGPVADSTDAAGRDVAWRSAPSARGNCDLRLAVVLCTPSRTVESLDQDREVNAFSLERFPAPARVVGKPARCSITGADTNPVARRKLLGCAHTLVGACERLLGKTDLHDQGLLTAQTARIQEHSTATGDLGVGPWIAVVGGIEQIPSE